MVAVFNEIRTTYPLIHGVVLDLRNVERNAPRVFKAFLKHSGLSRTQARAALTLDVPSLRIVPSLRVLGVEYVPGYARYTGNGYTDEFALRTEFAEQFQALQALHDPLDESLGNSYRVLHRARRLMESKLLHELVHWARARVSRLPAGPQSGPGEVGWKFERDAYGFDVTSHRLGLSNYIRSF